MSYIENKDLRITVFEAVGTLIFTYGVGCASLAAKTDVSPADGVMVACSLLAGLALCAEITDGHLNPILSLAANINGRSKHMTVNMMGQFIGGVLGAILFWIVTGKSAIPVPEGPDGITGHNQLKFVLNELVGSFFFATCVMVVTNHRTSYANKSWQMYLSVIVSLFLVRTMTGETPVNPAIAVPYQILASILTPEKAVFWKLIYVIVPSLIGGGLAGYTVGKFYEPLLLFTKFKGELEMDEQDHPQHLNENEKENENENENDNDNENEHKEKNAHE